MNDLEQLESELEASIHGLLDATLPQPEMGRLIALERDIVPNKGAKKRNQLLIALLLGLSGLAAAYYLSKPGISIRDHSIEPNMNTITPLPEKNDNKIITETYEKNDSDKSPVIYRQEVISGE